MLTGTGDEIAYLDESGAGFMGIDVSNGTCYFFRYPWQFWAIWTCSLSLLIGFAIMYYVFQCCSACTRVQHVLHVLKKYLSLIAVVFGLLFSVLSPTFLVCITNADFANNMGISVTLLCIKFLLIFCLYKKAHQLKWNIIQCIYISGTLINAQILGTWLIITSSMHFAVISEMFNTFLFMLGYFFFTFSGLWFAVFSMLLFKSLFIRSSARGGFNTVMKGEKDYFEKHSPSFVAMTMDDKEDSAELNSDSESPNASLLLNKKAVIDAEEAAVAISHKFSFGNGYEFEFKFGNNMLTVTVCCLFVCIIAMTFTIFLPISRGDYEFFSTEVAAVLPIILNSFALNTLVLFVAFDIIEKKYKLNWICWQLTLLPNFKKPGVAAK